MRLVLDTNVVASALLWGGNPALLLRTGLELQRYSSPALLEELAEILGRRKFGQKIVASGMSVDALVAAYADLTTVVRPVSLSGVAPDPDDDVVIGTALAADAELIVTGDRGLLSVSGFGGVRIVTVGQALALLHGTQAGRD